MLDAPEMCTVVQQCVCTAACRAALDVPERGWDTFIETLLAELRNARKAREMTPPRRRSVDGAPDAL